MAKHGNNRAIQSGTWAGSEELLACCFHSTPSDIRELRVRADAGFGYGPVLDMLEARLAQYSVVARMTPSLKREVIRLAYNLVTAFQRTCLPAEWQSFTLSKLRHKLFWLPGELTRPQNRPILRFANSPLIRKWVDEIFPRIHRLKPLEAEATLGKVKRPMQTFWREMRDFRAFLKEISAIHDGFEFYNYPHG